MRRGGGGSERGSDDPGEFRRPAERFARKAGQADHARHDLQNKLTPYQKADALVVPPKTVFADPQNEEEKVVYLLDKEGKSEKRTVKVGKQTDKQVEILKGLAKEIRFCWSRRKSNGKGERERTKFGMTNDEAKPETPLAASLADEWFCNTTMFYRRLLLLLPLVLVCTGGLAEEPSGEDVAGRRAGAAAEAGAHAAGRGDRRVDPPRRRVPA